MISRRSSIRSMLSLFSSGTLSLSLSSPDSTRSPLKVQHPLSLLSCHYPLLAASLEPLTYPNNFPTTSPTLALPITASAQTPLSTPPSSTQWIFWGSAKLSSHDEFLQFKMYWTIPCSSLRTLSRPHPNSCGSSESPQRPLRAVYPSLKTASGASHLEHDSHTSPPLLVWSLSCSLCWCSKLRTHWWLGWVR